MKELKEDWQEVRLGDICTINYGRGLVKSKVIEGNIPVYSSSGITNYHNESLVNSKGIIIGRKGNAGSVFYSKVPFFCIDTTFYITENKNYDLNFLYYNLISLSLENYKTGTAVPGITRNDLYSISTKLPPLKEQKKIASILSSLDDKIELNNRMNKILEETAQTIFKEWFINFNFPNEEGKPYKKSGGKMIESELGEIPKGWEVGVINDLILNTFTGDWGKDKKDGKYSSSVICIRGADIAEISRGFNGNPVNRFILEKNLMNKKLNIGDIIMECSGGSPTQSTGRCAIITEELLNTFDKPLICTNFCRVIKSNETFLSYFTYNLLWYLYKINLFFLFENGTTGIKNLDINNLFSKYSIVIPNKNIIKKFSDIYSNFLKNIYKNKKENQKLASIRDNILPKLMSGEIRIK